MDTENFQLIFDESPNGIVVFDPTTLRPVEFNDQAAEMMGYSREEFARLTITALELVPNPKETARHIGEIRAAGTDTFERRHRKKDGTPVDVVISLRYTQWRGHDAMLVIWHDVTERRAAEEALRQSEHRLATVLSSATDAILVLDKNLHIVSANPSAATVFQYGPTDLLGQPIAGLIVGASCHELWSRVRTSDSTTNSVWIPKGARGRRSVGESFPVEGTISAVEIGDSRHWTIILRDMNDRHQAEAELQRLHREKEALQIRLEEATGGSRIIGDSSMMQTLHHQIDRVATTDSAVLIQGETGTGKELIAQAIHRRSVRRDSVLVAVNCAALPSGLVESELFGHEKGAFTGATHRRQGKFELADGGTLFLDEVAELDAHTQAKLLRALQDGEIQPLGGQQSRRVNVRVLAASHRDLERMSQEGEFRTDLYYRISVFPLRVPPLRERRSDIPALLDHYVAQCARNLQKELTGFDPTSLSRLLSYSWPGNVSELKNVVERAAILADGSELQVRDGELEGPTVARSPGTTLNEAIRAHLIHTLDSTQWKLEGPHGAAKRLGIAPSTLRFRMKKLGIHRPPEAAKRS